MKPDWGYWHDQILNVTSVFFIIEVILFDKIKLLMGEKFHKTVEFWYLYSLALKFSKSKWIDGDIECLGLIRD